MQLWLIVAGFGVIATIYGLSLWYRGREYRALRRKWEEIVAHDRCPVCHLIGQHKLQCPNRWGGHGPG